MTDPPRLLDGHNEGLGPKLLRSAARDRAPIGALSRALQAAGLAATVATASAAKAATTVTSGSAATASTIVTTGAATVTLGTAAAGSATVKVMLLWVTVGVLSGTAVSVGAHRWSASGESESVSAPSTHGKLQINERALPPGSRAGTGEQQDAPRPVSPAASTQLAADPSAAATPPDPAAAPKASLRRAPAPVATESAASSILETHDETPRNTSAFQDPPAASTATAIPSRELGAERGHPHPEPHRPTNAPFFDELALVDRARSQLASGDPRSALATAAHYHVSFPRGQFKPEMMVLRVEALVASGQRDSAQALARRFLATYPTHPLANRIRKTTALR